jgi:hypothetical protein
MVFGYSDSSSGSAVRVSYMLKENNERFSEASRRDFKIALQENIFAVFATIASIEFTKSRCCDLRNPILKTLP